MSHVSQIENVVWWFVLNCFGICVVFCGLRPFPKVLYSNYFKEVLYGVYMANGMMSHLVYGLLLVILVFGGVFYVEDVRADFQQQMRQLSWSVHNQLTTNSFASQQGISSLRNDFDASVDQLAGDLEETQFVSRKLNTRVRDVDDQLKNQPVPANLVAVADKALDSLVKISASLRNDEFSEQIGSGFFVDGNGHVVTNAHVILIPVYSDCPNPDDYCEPDVHLVPADTLTIFMKNGKVKTARVVGYDPKLDVAVLAIDDRVDHFLQFSNHAVHVGDRVLALGHPLGVLDFTTTVGVVSALRELEGARYIQYDASITFGNSGGPLVDDEGKVIGVTVAGIPFFGDFNFAIPAEDAKKVVGQIISSD